MFPGHEESATKFAGVSDRHLDTGGRPARLAAGRSGRTPRRVRVRVSGGGLTVSGVRGGGERVRRQGRRCQRSPGHVSSVLPVCLERLLQRLPGRAHRGGDLRRADGGGVGSRLRPASVFGIGRSSVPRQLTVIVVVGAAGRRQDVLEADMSDLEGSRIEIEEPSPRRLVVRPTARRRTLPGGRQSAP